MKRDEFECVDGIAERILSLRAESLTLFSEEEWEQMRTWMHQETKRLYRRLAMRLLHPEEFFGDRLNANLQAERLEEVDFPALREEKDNRVIWKRKPVVSMWPGRWSEELLRKVERGEFTKSYPNWVFSTGDFDSGLTYFASSGKPAFGNRPVYGQIDVEAMLDRSRASAKREKSRGAATYVLHELVKAFVLDEVWKLMQGKKVGILTHLEENDEGRTIIVAQRFSAEGRSIRKIYKLHWQVGSWEHYTGDRPFQIAAHTHLWSNPDFYKYGPRSVASLKGSSEDRKQLADLFAREPFLEEGTKVHGRRARGFRLSSYGRAVRDRCGSFAIELAEIAMKHQCMTADEILREATLEVADRGIAES
jgi:hypothetical protein